MKHIEPSEGANRKRLRILAWRGHRKPELLGSAHRWTRLRMDEAKGALSNHMPQQQLRPNMRPLAQKRRAQQRDRNHAWARTVAAYSRTAEGRAPIARSHAQAHCAAACCRPALGGCLGARTRTRGRAWWPSAVARRRWRRPEHTHARAGSSVGRAVTWQRAAARADAHARVGPRVGCAVSWRRAAARAHTHAHMG